VFPASVFFDEEMRPRSIIAESDCSDDDDELRDDEGWIPIAWDDSTPASPSPVETQFPVLLPSSRSVRSESSVSSFRSGSIFDDLEEWTPPMTPVSPCFGDRVSSKWDKHLSVCTEYYVEENIDWIFESVCREKYC
jgi:hypothetical protein